MRVRQSSVGGHTGDGLGGFTTSRGNDTARYGETQHEDGDGDEAALLHAQHEDRVFANGAFKVLGGLYTSTKAPEPIK